ncbi:MAG: hypothetical protein AAGD38_03720 [Acidobacteriota bacterium]
MRIRYHELESLEHILAHRPLPGGDDQPVRIVVFGGTGAVGGAVVLTLCRLILLSERYRATPMRTEIWATGIQESDLDHLAERLDLAFGRQTTVERNGRRVRVGDRIDIRLYLFAISLPSDLEAWVDEARDDTESFDFEATMAARFAAQPRPFLNFVEQLSTPPLLNAVVVAIPLPSVAAYTLGKLDRLSQAQGLDQAGCQRVKSAFLDTFVSGLGAIRQRHARRVLMAHTTGVGGMVRVDGGEAEIVAGFAHSARGRQLAEKKHFADQLTEIYLDLGFDVMITAAAIGIDAVEENRPLPADRAARRALEELTTSTVDPGDFKSPNILLYGAADCALDDGKHTVDMIDPERPLTRHDSALHFGGGHEIELDVAIRSGENGFFSVANCVALYHVMQVAIAEELALVMVRRAVFGPERRGDWFEDRLCYYAETDNCRFALALLEHHGTLIRAHLGPFSIKAFQALGSATHQARLHETGLLMLLLRLRELAPVIDQLGTLALERGAEDVDAFLWRHTRKPTFDDLAALDAAELADGFAALCTLRTGRDAAIFLGTDDDNGKISFLEALARAVRRHLCTITSLGIPILYRHPKMGDRVLHGPFVGPLELAPTDGRALGDTWRALAERCGASYEATRNWTIANNGFVDLRPHALVSAAKEACPELDDQVRQATTEAELLGILDTLRPGQYFTAGGTVALRTRLLRLHERAADRRLELGTFETWKNLFPVDDDGRLILVPGLIEMARMHAEGLGKVTGTEVLWPDWGY